MEQNLVLDVIIDLLKGSKAPWEELSCTIGGKRYILRSCPYLLNQALRLYALPDSHFLVSVKAKELWSKITSEPINHYGYQSPVIYEGSTPITLDLYRGNENTFTSKTFSHGDSFAYRAVFHDDHIVPLKIIIEQLLALNEITYESVENVLNGIYICRMLKSEDRSLNNKSSRPGNYLEVIHGLYKEHGIEIAD